MTPPPIMHAVLQLSPNDRLVPEWAKLRAYGMRRIYYAAMYKPSPPLLFTPNVRQVDPSYRKLTLDNGFDYGIFRDPYAWGDVMAPDAIAKAVDNDIALATDSNPLRSCAYIVDGELPHDASFWLATWKAIRKRRPRRLFAWTIEAHQGGWIADPALRDFINNDVNLVLLPQLYDGLMRAYPWDEVLADLTSRGIDALRVQPMRDGKTIVRGTPTVSSGCTFHAERLAPVVT